MLPALFALTLFLSACLVFVVQPVAGKELLPLAGGTPAVWTTCLLFFQAVLLVGYGYADRLTRLPPHRQVRWHLLLGGLALTLVLTIRPNPDWIPVASDYPIFGLIAFLTVWIGMPFFFLSATAPLLQRWFTTTGHRSGSDPYFLYAASNAGSLIGLLGYPFVIEPLLTLPDQFTDWLIGYAGLLLLMTACAATIRTTASHQESQPAPPTPLSDRDSAKEDSDSGPTTHVLVPTVPPSEGPPTEAPPSRWQLGKWVALAALPSSFLMSATTHLTTDIAPVPLLWVVPLALYLLSFIIVFARWPDRARLVIGRTVPMLILFLTVALLTRATEPLLIVAGIHLFALLGVSLLCHGELAADRPAPRFLTTFYLALSVGGVVGGLVNALLAPILFARLGLLEYPLAIVLIGLIRPEIGKGLVPLRFSRRDGVWLLVFVGLVAGLVWQIPEWVSLPRMTNAPEQLIVRLLRSGLMFGLPAVVAFALVRNPARFAVCLLVLFLAGFCDTGPHGETLLTSRNFFGTLRVVHSSDGRFVQLVHGTTTHGQQPVDTHGPPPPSTYYSPTGPAGRLLTHLPPARRQRVALVGLGVGALAAYAEPGEHWTYYEIDPAVVRIARDSGYFTFLHEARGTVDIILGDARRQLALAPDGRFDLIVLDAFSSDAIPVHLLTQEAFALYSRKLAPHGVLAFHLSNRYLDLPPLVARLAANAEPPFSLWLDDDFVSDRERAEGKYPSTWVVLARDPRDLGPVAADRRWQRLRATAGPIWTDTFSNLLSVWKVPNP
ncbi:MAG: fused MFS/spermidine synthase [Bacteroidales bacterium]|nr:fused MFS/spermidine synthase [Bacteroidales bacterium]